ncbi:TrmH family RNA methyltransferase [Flavobacterium selenitireducens]|uniref:TrmH family RNA methyltransferase n=1 Tax=Flavobacterium selenitireducens TaxID=2722704 RepID=UPI00168B1B8D|nr:RNA methyltransferase [Flavobacterium selenitireducens]MBD3583159.1 RNA methyltransferase [Flavobacterium selenitireducens]
MVSKNQIKRITGLHQKKYRQQEGLFLAEGAKVISELLESDFELEHLFETEPLFPEIADARKTSATASDLKKMTTLSTANNCLAVFHIPNPKPIDKTGIIVALDDIRDPGNLGTIVRLCDWFGISEVVCSRETAELYNPKVVQATMGSLTRVNVSYLDLPEFLSNAELPVFGTFMDGDDIYSEALPQNGIIVMGNEANGISREVETLVNKRISIPRFGNLQKTESLNVATATAIVLSEFRRTRNG